jgi:peptidoglycan/LPS O-acetylase OafA/YrhL
MKGTGDRLGDPQGALASSRVAGLDALRFVLALWVVFSHVGFVPLLSMFGLEQVWIARGLYNNLFSGPAAVIVFFVISGFCIHRPAATGDAIVAFPYYVRRYVRILVPMAIGVWLSNRVGHELHSFHDSILWSLVCEEVYYAIYPALLVARRRSSSWLPLVAVAFVAALVVVLRAPGAGDYPSFGPALNWVVGLPCWLLGCELAERTLRPRRAPPPGAIWGWRAAAWALASLCSVLRFHTPLGYPWTLDLFAVFAFFWLEREIAHHRVRPPPRVLEWAGKWSYSLYLVHVAAGLVFARLALDLSPATRWLAAITFVLAACYGFYLLVERPAHLAARRISEALKPAPAAATTVTS